MRCNHVDLYPTICGDILRELHLESDDTAYMAGRCMIEHGNFVDHILRYIYSCVERVLLR